MVKWMQDITAIRDIGGRAMVESGKHDYDMKWKELPVSSIESIAGTL